MFSDNPKLSRSEYIGLTIVMCIFIIMFGDLFLLKIPMAWAKIDTFSTIMLIQFVFLVITLSSFIILPVLMITAMCLNDLHHSPFWCLVLLIPWFNVVGWIYLIIAPGKAHKE